MGLHLFCKYGLPRMDLRDSVGCHEVLYDEKSLPEKHPLVPAHNPAGTNNVAHLYRVESRPGTNVFCPHQPLSLPLSFFSLFSHFILITSNPIQSHSDSK
jgi:hypothetical protein